MGRRRRMSPGARRGWWLAALLLLPPAWSGAGASLEAQEVTYIRVATLAPDGSPWMRVFRALDGELDERTGGQLRLRIYGGGSQGQEGDYIAKMRSGQLDAAALTSTGLSTVVRPVLVLGLPGIVDDYETLDRVRRRMGPRFERLFEREGFVLLGWGDVGKGRLFSKRRIERPTDLRAARPWAPTSDVVFSEFLSVVGAQPRRLGVTEVYPALQTGMVDTVPGSALAAVALQWHSHLRYYSRDHSGILVGASVMRKEKWDSLSEEHRQTIREVSRRAHRVAKRMIRRADDAALRVVQQRMEAVDTTPHRAEWNRYALRTRDRLLGRVFPRALFDAVLRAADE